MDPATQQLLAFIFGIILVFIMIVLAVAFPTPSTFQYNVFRTVLALAGGGVGAMLPGFLSVKFEPGTALLVQAGGAFAAFVLLFFFNPARLVAHNVNSPRIEDPKVDPPSKNGGPR